MKRKGESGNKSKKRNSNHRKNKQEVDKMCFGCCWRYHWHKVHGSVFNTTPPNSNEATFLEIP